MTVFIDRYEIRRGLAQGATGSVYLAYDPKVGREVALKVLHERHARDSKQRQRFEREARAIAALRHPNIVEIYDYGGSPDDYLFLVMEYLSGPHLGRLSRLHGPMPASVLAACGFELSAALAHAHDKGVIHRDIKPENIFIDHGRLVLVDFGIVKGLGRGGALGAAAADPHTDIIGTPGFMAPEQLEQQPLEPRTDVFGLGATLYYLATGELAFPATSLYELQQRFRDGGPRALASLRPALPAGICELVHACLVLDPEARPQTVAAVRVRLRELLEGLGVRDAREVLSQYESNPKHASDLDRQVAQQYPTRRFRRWRWLWVALLLVAVAGGGWLAMSQGLLGRPTTRSAPAPGLCRVEVRAAAGTQIEVNGAAVGTTPLAAPLLLPPGRHDLVLLHGQYGRLQQEIILPLASSLVLEVDWPARQVRVASR